MRLVKLRVYKSVQSTVVKAERRGHCCKWLGRMLDSLRGPTRTKTSVRSIKSEPCLADQLGRIKGRTHPAPFAPARFPPAIEVGDIHPFLQAHLVSSLFDTLVPCCVLAKQQLGPLNRAESGHIRSTP